MINPWKKIKELKEQIEELKRAIAIMEKNANGECTTGHHCSVCNNAYRHTGILGTEVACKLIAAKRCKHFKAVGE